MALEVFGCKGFKGGYTDVSIGSGIKAWQFLAVFSSVISRNLEVWASLF